MARSRMGFPAAYITLLAIAPLNAHAVRIDYTVDAGLERDDNVLMASENEVASTSLRGGLGFLVSEDTSTVQANFGGRLEYWNYIDGPQSNTLETSLAGRINWFFVPETLSFTIEDRLEMRPIDRFAPETVNNRQRVNVLSLGPNAHFNFSDAFRGRFEVRWIDSNAEVTDEFESERISAALHLLRETSPTSNVTFSLRAQDVDFDHDFTARDYRRYDAFVRYQKDLSRISFGVDAGHSWVDYADGSNASYPVVRGDIQVRAGDRGAMSLSVAHQLSDTASVAIDGIGTTTTVPTDLGTGSTAINSSIYKDNRADLTYSFTTERTRLLIGPYYQRVEYLDVLAFDETRRGSLFQVAYQFKPTWEALAFVDVSRSSFPGLGLRTEDLRGGVSLVKTWSRNWSSSIQYSRYERKDDGFYGDSRQNMLFLTISYRNR